MTNQNTQTAQNGNMSGVNAEQEGMSEQKSGKWTVVGKAAVGLGRGAVSVVKGVAKTIKWGVDQSVETTKVYPRTALMSMAVLGALVGARVNDMLRGPDILKESAELIQKLEEDQNGIPDEGAKENGSAQDASQSAKNVSSVVHAWMNANTR